MSEDTNFVNTEEIIDNTTSQDTRNDTDNEVVDRSRANLDDFSVILGDSENISSESDLDEESTEEEINFDIDLDTMRVRSNMVLNNYQRISATYGYAIFVENTALKLTLGNVLLSGQRIFGIKNSFVDITTVGLEMSWDCWEKEDLDYESTLVMKITEGSEFTGCFNKYNRVEVGNISVTVDNSSRWYLTGDSYIEEFNIEDHSRVTLNGYNIYVRTKVKEDEYIYRKWVQYPPKMIAQDTGYDSKGVPKNKVLKVIKYEYLPPKNERYKSYIYFCYDRMQLYLYQSLYTDPFCIIEELPANPVESMLYITTEGKMYTYYSGMRTFIGEVEKNTEDVPDPDQIALLKQAGTVYFMNAESRYLDVQSRTIQLPFQNGEYILSLSLGADLRIDDHTVIKYNPNTEQFYIAGQDYQFEDKLNNVGKYSGFLTETAETYMDGNTFRSYVSISDAAGNGIEVLDSGGLYVDVSDLASQEKYEQIVKSFNTYKIIIDNYMADLVEAVTACTGEVTADVINTKIATALVEYSDLIDEALANYDELHTIIEDIENRIITQLRVAIEEDRTAIYGIINKSRWDVYDGDDPYVPPESDVPDVSGSWSDTDKAAILRWFRSYVRYNREEHYDYGRADVFGFTEKEHWLLGRVLSYDLPSLGNPDTDKYYVYLSEDPEGEEPLPTTGETAPVYFVINILESNRIYKVYKWYDDEFHIVYDGSITTINDLPEEEEESEDPENPSEEP